jgi:hypothetical protein
MFKEIRTTDAPEPLPPSRDLIKDAFVEMQRIQPEKTSESATTKKEALHTMNGRSYEMVDPEKVSGPYLTEEFETELFRRQGFSVDKIHMVEPPSSQYNPLGYALFGRGAITSKEAQKVLEDNFVPEAPVQPEYGRVFRYNPEAQTLTGGWIESMSDDGKVTAIRRQWRVRGAIWKHHPDLLGVGWQTYREKTSWDKWELMQIRGQARLKDAKEIFVCEQHLKSDHRKRIQAAIKHIAKKGDVVLVEGAESGVEVHRSEYPDIPGEILLIGWDNMKLRKELRDVLERESELTNRGKEARQAGNTEEYIKIKNRLDALQNNAANKIFIERNKSLDATLTKTRERFPDARIFIIAGAAHFSPGSTLRERLEAQTAAVFMPHDTVTLINAAKARQALPDWMQ